MFVLAYPEDREHIAYVDVAGNKYIAKGGTLAWRLNNPGLVPSRSPVAKKSGSIGTFETYAIFPSADHGRGALASWLRLKKYFDSPLKVIAKHYQPNDPEGFITKLQALAELPKKQKIENFTRHDFDHLCRAVEKLCDFVALGNETFSLLPKIDGRIENGKGKEDSYLIGGGTILSKTETIAWIKSFRLDASIVHGSKGNIHFRSRPRRSFWHVKASLLTVKKNAPIATVARIVGQRKAGQCIWGFINGIYNTKERALRSAEVISSAAGGEAVISLPNDTQGLIDALACLALKCAIDTPTISLAAHFFRYLLVLSEEENRKQPVVIFAHSQGAIICEHALKYLTLSERIKLRIFSFGGGSFIAPGQSHPDSHNYANAADPVCRLGSPHLQPLALEQYAAQKKGMSLKELIQKLSMRDTLLHVRSLNSSVIKAYAKKRSHYYEKEFKKISNVTVLDPDPTFPNQHDLEYKGYQTTIQSLIKRYQSTA